MHASRLGEPTIFHWLVSKGGDINKSDKNLNCPVAIACFHGHAEILRILIEAKAELHTKNENGQTPLMTCSWNGHYECAKLLVEAGLDVNVREGECHCVGVVV